MAGDMTSLIGSLALNERWNVACYFTTDNNVVYIIQFFDLSEDAYPSLGAGGCTACRLQRVQ